MARFPDVHVELVLNDRFVDPIEEGFDVTIRIGEAVYSSSLIAREIVYSKRVLCASPGYLERCGEPVECVGPTLFLLSDDASFITATDLPIDAGYQSMGPEGLGKTAVFAGSD